MEKKEESGGLVFEFKLETLDRNERQSNYTV